MTILHILVFLLLKGKFPVLNETHLDHPPSHLVVCLLGQQKCNRERIDKWNAEQRLICDLLDNYQVKWGRPVRNMTEDVEVRFGLQLIHISDLVSCSFSLSLSPVSRREHLARISGWEKPSFNHQSVANLCKLAKRSFIPLICIVFLRFFFFSGMGWWSIDLVSLLFLLSFSLLNLMDFLFPSFP